MTKRHWYSRPSWGRVIAVEVIEEEGWGVRFYPNGRITPSSDLPADFVMREATDDAAWESNWRRNELQAQKN